MLKRVLVEGFTLRQLHSQRPQVALPTYRYRFRQALQRWVARPSPQPIPRGPLVLLADGLWFEFDGIPWVLYLTALKACSSNHATFLDPLLLPGREGASRWQQAIQAIPPDAVRRIRALVVDNLPGLQKIAEQHQWVLQLCQFHLLLKLQAQRGGARYRLRGGGPSADRGGLLATFPDVQGKCREFPGKAPTSGHSRTAGGLTGRGLVRQFPAKPNREVRPETQGTRL